MLKREDVQNILKENIMKIDKRTWVFWIIVGFILFIHTMGIL